MILLLPWNTFYLNLFWSGTHPAAPGTLVALVREAPIVSRPRLLLRLLQQHNHNHNNPTWPTSQPSRSTRTRLRWTALSWWEQTDGIMATRAPTIAIIWPAISSAQFTWFLYFHSGDAALAPDINKNSFLSSSLSHCKVALRGMIRSNCAALYFDAVVRW